MATKKKQIAKPKGTANFVEATPSEEEVTFGDPNPLHPNQIVVGDEATKLASRARAMTNPANKKEG